MSQHGDENPHSIRDSCPGESPLGGNQLAHSIQHGQSDGEDQEQTTEQSYLATQMGPESFLGSVFEAQCDRRSCSQAVEELCKEQTVDTCAKHPPTFSLSPCLVLPVAAVAVSQPRSTTQQLWRQLLLSWLSEGTGTLLFKKI